MNDATRKRIERQLAEKVLGATAHDCEMPAAPYPQIEWGVQDIWLFHLDHDSEVSIEWSPTRNFPDAFALLGRLVEKSLEQSYSSGVNFCRIPPDKHRAIVWALGRQCAATAETPAETLTLAICEVLGISTEDENGR